MRRGPGLNLFTVLLLVAVAAVVFVRVSHLTRGPDPKTKTTVRAKPIPKRWRPYVASERRCPSRGEAKAAQEALMRCLINYARRKSGLSDTLGYSDALYRSSRQKASRILACQDFSHRPCGDAFITTFREAGYGSPAGGWQVGENLAWGERGAGSPRHILAGWLDSPEHRKNLLRRGWQEQAVYVRRARLDNLPVTLWVSQFGQN